MGLPTNRTLPVGPGLEVRRPEGSLTPATGIRSGFRPDIQALRAVAVGMVVLSHLWPHRLTGGYVGVDVFFVISGFLITSHLSKEIFATGKLRLVTFYSKRIRRLLPAAFVVLGVSLIWAVMILPFSRWKDTAQQVLASALYAENWVLAANAVDYSASTASATVAQHYWSLSVEEQFYVFWPLLMVGLVTVAARFNVRPRVVLAAGISVAAAFSFTSSAYLAQAGHHEAYFYTHVRLWEFGVGAGLALVAGRIKFQPVTGNVIALLGFAGLLASAVLYNAATPFPGTAALLPVVATALVIGGGTPGHDMWHSRLTSSRPVQFMGNISYSLYLWHWPMIVVAPFLINAEPDTSDKLILLAAAVPLAWATKVWVEDKGLQFRPKSRPAAKTVIVMILGIAVLAAGTGGVSLALQLRESEAERTMQTQELSVCYGPRAMDPGAECSDRFGPAFVPTMSEANAYYEPATECGDFEAILMAGDGMTTRFCDFSGGAPDAPIVWLVGDSHAQQWQEPLFDLAQRNKWLLKISLLGACPLAAVDYAGYRGSMVDEGTAKKCMGWGQSVSEAVAADRPQYVFTSSFARMEHVDDGSGRSQNEQYADGFGEYWKAWTSAGSSVVVLADPPYNVDVRPADCALLNVEDPAKCAVDRSMAAPEDPIVYAARANEDQGVKLVDLTDYFCDDDRCYSVIGGVVVYFDGDHLNGEFSRLLAPMIEARL
ncbi:MAG: acyltransferase family protein [Cellulosimicrobium cellulans]